MSQFPELDLDSVLPNLAAEHLRRGSPLRARARGRSMWPFLRDGTDVELSPCAPEELRVGDVVLVELDKQLLLHRIVSRQGTGFRTKGDARRRDDGVIPPARIMARLPPQRRGPLIAAVSLRFSWVIWLSENMYRQFFDRAQGRP